MPFRTKGRPLFTSAFPRLLRGDGIQASHFIVNLLILSGIACDSGIDSSGSSSLAIYRLRDANIAASQVWNSPLGDLVLEKTPFLTQNEITIYRWKTHQFEVAKSVDARLDALRSQSGPVGGIPFVVTVGKDRIYLGAFWYSYSSLTPHVPYIDVILDSHTIRAAWLTQNQADVRNDQRIYAALEAAGVLVE